MQANRWTGGWRGKGGAGGELVEDGAVVGRVCIIFLSS